MISFDVESLFTNLPLEEIINLAIDYIIKENSNTVEPRLSGPRLSGLFDYPDFFLWSQFFHE